MNEKKDFSLTLIAIVAAYAVKKFFEAVSKAMDCGYNATLRAEKYGEMRFTHPVADIEDDEPKNSDYENQGDPQELDSEVSDSEELDTRLEEEPPGGGVTSLR